MFESHCDTIDSGRRFGSPLDAVFKSFDFQPPSFNPDGAPFKFLREKIFQMHLLLGATEHSFAIRS
jgi:hypothetical protein